MGEPHAGPSGIRLHRRRRDDHRPPRPGRRQRRRLRRRRGAPRRRVQPRGPRGRRPPHLLHLQRRRPDGGRLARGGFIRGALQAREAHRLLRRQPDHDRRQHRPHVQRRYGQAVRGLRLAGAAPLRRERSRRDRPRGRRSQGGHVAPDARRHAHAHRLRQPEEAGHRVRTRRAARRRGGGGDEEGAGLAAAGGDVLRARGRARQLAPGPRARRRGARRMEDALLGLSRRVRRRGGGTGAPARGQPPRGLGQGHPVVHEGERLGGEPRGVERRAQRARARAPRADRRLGGPHAVQRHRGEVVAAVRADPLRGTLHALRRARARDGVDHERDGAARRPRTVRRHLPDLLRLHAPGDPARRVHEAAHRLHLHPRLDRSRRGRPDAPADRAALGAARHPRAHGPAPRRRDRDGGIVAHRGAARGRTGVSRAHAAEARSHRPHEVRERGRRREGRLRRRRRGGRRTAGGADVQRLRARAGGCGVSVSPCCCWRLLPVAGAGHRAARPAATSTSRA